MKAHIDKTKSQLGELGALGEKTEIAERKILEAAEKRLGEVEGEIGKAGAGLEAADDASQQRYLDLVAERGQLHTVIGKARTVLGET